MSDALFPDAIQVPANHPLRDVHRFGSFELEWHRNAADHRWRATLGSPTPWGQPIYVHAPGSGPAPHVVVDTDGSVHVAEEFAEVETRARAGTPTNEVIHRIADRLQQQAKAKGRAPVDPSPVDYGF